MLNPIIPTYVPMFDDQIPYCIRLANLECLTSTQGSPSNPPWYQSLTPVLTNRILAYTLNNYNQSTSFITIPDIFDESWWLLMVNQGESHNIVSPSTPQLSPYLFQGQVSRSQGAQSGCEFTQCLQHVGNAGRGKWEYADLTRKHCDFTNQNWDFTRCTWGYLHK